MLRTLRLLVTLCFVGIVAVVAAVAALYLTVPQSNAQLTHFDTIIVLGSPANPDGTPSAEQRERVLEGVREYRAGVAPHIIMTGGAAHNRWVEAHVMAELAERNGVPPVAVIEEGRAQNTIQNAYYSIKLMRGCGWRSAEVVSSPSHLPRASLIFSHFPIEWRMHAAHWPVEYEVARTLFLYTAEAGYTAKLRLFGFHPTPFLPAIAH